MDVEQKMQIAIDVAKKSLVNKEFPVGAVIFNGDEIISAAYSSGESNKVFLEHAEIKALIEADRRQYSLKMRKEMQLFVTLEPCMMCLGAAMAFFIGEIYYALEAPIDGAVSYAQQFWNRENKEIPSYKLPKIYGGILKSQSQDLLREYIKINSSGQLVEFSKSLLLL